MVFYNDLQLVTQIPADKMPLPFSYYNFLYDYYESLQSVPSCLDRADSAGPARTTRGSVVKVMLKERMMTSFDSQYQNALQQATVFWYLLFFCEKLLMRDTNLH